jgi:glycosyltransferase involved in cell wall biosynthesis
MTHLDISVIIPAYNAQRTILRALESVIAQTLQPVEIIVVDDGSSENMVSIVENFPQPLKPGFIKVIRLDSNHGPAFARNAGWEKASGKFLAFLDSDDSWHPRKLEIQGNYMVNHAELALTGHRLIRLTEHDKPDGLPENWSVNPVSAWQLLVSFQFSTSSVILKRNIPYRFNPCKRHSEDRLLWLQIALNGYKAACLELPLVYFYKAPYGEAGLSSNLWKAEKGELDTYTQLRKMGLLNRLEETLLKVWSFLKYLRRVWLCWRRSHLA